MEATSDLKHVMRVCQTEIGDISQANEDDPLLVHEPPKPMVLTWWGNKQIIISDASKVE